ncbi:MAG: hypothetical protein K2J95_11485 [Lachnospiraceae bacterium]|nr:hypothetical protein [Lachnospiraceae bacterium]MDE6744491.1 hypothetical protein [Lachnospiraceae bacterium]
MPRVFFYEDFQKYYEENCMRNGHVLARVSKNIRLSVTLHKQLIDYCQQEKINKSDLLEHFVKDYLKNCDKTPGAVHFLTRRDHIIIRSNYDVDLTDSTHIERQVFAFRIFDHLYDEFNEQCKKNNQRICDVLEEMIAAYLICNNNLGVLRVSKYNRLSTEIHTKFAQRCKELKVNKSELMEYLFSCYIEYGRQDKYFNPLLGDDYDEIQKRYQVNLRMPIHIDRIICVFRVSNVLYDDFCGMCVKNKRKICNVMEEMMASFLLETDAKMKKTEEK